MHYYIDPGINCFSVVMYHYVSENESLSRSLIINTQAEGSQIRICSILR